MVALSGFRSYPLSGSLRSLFCAKVAQKILTP
jgi:hypothetical protein